MFADVLSLNWQLFEDLNQEAGHAPGLDRVMIFGASDLVFFLPVLLLALWLGLARWSPFARETGGERTAAWRGLGQRLALMSCVAVVVAIGLNIVIGHLLYEPRPFVSHPGVVHQLVAHASDAAFPSDHEAFSAAVAVLLVICALRLAFGTTSAAVRRLVWVVAALAVVMALFIGVARVYVGVHYPGDIAGGMVCGTIGALVASGLRPFAEPVLGPVVRLAERLHLA